MKNREFADRLLDLLHADHDYAATFEHQIRRVRTYEEVGMLTRDAGLVVELEDGTEFQLTVVAR
jgi:hypothetical protein